jgi:hypothetical protein
MLELILGIAVIYIVVKLNVLLIEFEDKKIDSWK